MINKKEIYNNISEKINIISNLYLIIYIGIYVIDYFKIINYKDMFFNIYVALFDFICLFLFTVFSKNTINNMENKKLRYFLFAGAITISGFHVIIYVMYLALLLANEIFIYLMKLS